MRTMYQAADFGPGLRGLGDLGDFRADLVNALAVVLGKSKAEEVVSGFERLIEEKAKEGAEQAIPDIKAQVEKVAAKKVTPLVLGAMAVGGAGLLFGLIAIISVKKHTRRAR